MPDWREYPEKGWFWRHLDQAGRERALAELWALRRFEPRDHDEAFWRIAEIARIEGNLDVPEPLPEPDAALLAEVEAAQAQRLRAWMAWGNEAIRERARRRTFPEEKDEGDKE